MDPSSSVMSVALWNTMTNSATWYLLDDEKSNNARCQADKGNIITPPRGRCRSDSGSPRPLPSGAFFDRSIKLRERQPIE